MHLFAVNIHACVWKAALTEITEVTCVNEMYFVVMVELEQEVEHFQYAHVIVYGNNVMSAL